MSKAVDQDTKKKVVIKPGWLIEQFAKYVCGLHLAREESGYKLYQIDTSPVVVKHTGGVDPAIVLSEEFAAALQRYDDLVYRKNEQYGDAWQVDGPVTALTDLKDKLYRLESASKSGAILTWDPDKKRGTEFDILVRSIMLLAWDDLNFKDDDDDGPRTS